MALGNGRAAEAGGQERFEVAFDAKVKKLGFEALWDEEFPVVGALKPDGAAVRCGVLEGDVMLEINGTSTQGKTRDELMPSLKSRPLRITLGRVRQGLQTGDEAPGSGGQERERIEVAFDVKVKKLGFEALWDDEFPAVGALKPDGAAMRCGVKEGDVMLEINGSSTQGKTRAELMPVLTSRPLVITLGRVRQVAVGDSSDDDMGESSDEEAGVCSDRLERDLALASPPRRVSVGEVVASHNEMSNEALSQYFKAFAEDAEEVQGGAPTGPTADAESRETAEYQHQDSEEDEEHIDDEDLVRCLDEAWKSAPPATGNGAPKPGDAAAPAGAAAPGDDAGTDPRGDGGSDDATSGARGAAADNGPGVSWTPEIETRPRDRSSMTDGFVTGDMAEDVTQRTELGSAAKASAGGGGYPTSHTFAPFVPTMARMQVEVPPGRGPGSELVVLAPDGQKVQVTVPSGYGPGANLLVQFHPLSNQPAAADDKIETSKVLGNKNLLFHQGIAAMHSTDVWAARMRRFNTTGMAATKVGRNGQTYKRTFWLQGGCLRINGRNMCHIMSKDIKGIYKGLDSPEFKILCKPKRQKTLFGRPVPSHTVIPKESTGCVLALSEQGGVADHDGDRTLSLAFDREKDRDEFVETAAWYVQKMRSRASLGNNRPTSDNWQQDIDQC